MGYPGAGAARKTATAYVGDTATALTFLIKTSAGVAVDLRGYDAAYLSATYDGSWAFDLAALTIANDATGTLTITPTAAQVATAGTYEAIIKFVDGGAVTYSEPFNLQVLATGTSLPDAELGTWQIFRVKHGDFQSEVQV
jgi:hypothetical protein